MLNCRHCAQELRLPLIDLGASPPSNAYESVGSDPAPSIPLRIWVCESCWLVQTEDFAEAEAMFDAEYAYYSSFSTSWLKHCESYVDEMVARFELDASSLVVEVASNDGYLLQYVQQRSIPCYGIEPTIGTAAAAEAKGIKVVTEFFGEDVGSALAAEGQADLMAANNVLAHVPDINDFVKGFARLLKVSGVATFEFPHLMRLIDEGQFDTIYHEHFSYLSLTTIDQIFSECGLSVFDVTELPTHGGSLRVFAQRTDGVRQREESVDALLRREVNTGVATAEYYASLQSRAESTRQALNTWLNTVVASGSNVVGYGAAAKGNTLLNFSGVGPDLIEFVADANPHKQGKLLPGSRIPIVAPEEIRRAKPDYILVLPWNLFDEISGSLAYVSEWGCKLVRAIPEMEIAAP